MNKDGLIKPWFAFPQLQPEYEAFLNKGAWGKYVTALGQEALKWWFNMDIPSIAVHLTPLQEKLEKSAWPTRLGFLSEAGQQQINLDKVESWYHLFLKEDDFEAQCACIGAAIASVWDSGYDYSRYAQWYKRAQILLDRKNDISSLAVASLYGFKALVELTWLGDIKAAKESYDNLRFYAEKATSPSLRLFYAAAVSYCLLWMGRLSEIEMLLDDASVFLSDKETSLVVKIYFQTTVGLFHGVLGDMEKAVRVIMEIINLPFFEMLPPPAFFLAYGHLLYAVAQGGSSNQIDEIAQQVRRRAVPAQNYFHYSYLHFNLGIAYFLTGQPHKALIHSKEAIERGQLSGSQIAIRMPVLLHGQALSDLNRDREAIEHFWVLMDKWLEGNFMIIAAAGAVELAHLYAKRGEVEKAREYFEKVSRIMPQGESIQPLYRSANFLENLKSRIYPQIALAEKIPSSKDFLIEIETLGELRMHIGDNPISDRQWKGVTTKNLLKALIVCGGTKVSTALLIDILWPEDDADMALNSLKVAISRLRKLVGQEGNDFPPWIVVKHKQVSLSKTICFGDSFLFQDMLSAGLKEKNGKDLLIKALNLYKEDFLVNDNSAVWIIRHREILREKFIKGIFRLSEISQDSEDLERLLYYLQKASVKDPLNEEIYVRLMRVQLLLGYPAKAMKTFHLAQEILKKELGIEPGAALKSLARSIRKS